MDKQTINHCNGKTNSAHQTNTPPDTDQNAKHKNKMGGKWEEVKEQQGEHRKKKGIKKENLIIPNIHGYYTVKTIHRKIRENTSNKRTPQNSINSRKLKCAQSQT